MIRRGCATTIKAAVFGGALLAAASSPALATGEGVEFSANVSFTTDYVFRGISQTLNDPAIQGSIDATYKIFYIGMWGSNVDFGAGDPADLEIDYYAGITPSWQGFDFDFGVIFYTYPSTPSGYDIVEAKLGVSRTFYEKATLGFTAHISDRDYEAYEIAGSYEFNKISIFTPTASATVGFLNDHGTYLGTGDYTYWNAGVSFAFWDKPNLAIDVRYWDTDLSTGACGGNFCDERVVATLTASF
jgi:uncharacterized protein (TIGR02001 family)